MNQFTCFRDDDGNVAFAPGCLIDRSQSPTAHFRLEGAGGAVVIPSAGGWTSAAATVGMIFAGGSGRNVILTTSVAGLTVGTGSAAYVVKPEGIFTQTGAATWENQFFTITADLGAGTASMSDGTDVVATLTGSGSTDGPDGTFTLTTYGETTYNASSAGTATAAFEDDVKYQSAILSASVEGTLEVGGYTATAWGSWENDVDPTWTIDTDTDGTAEISDGTDIVATRSDGIDGDPSGIYDLSAYGQENYTAGEWSALEVSKVPVSAPMVGVYYVTATLDGSGDPDGLTGVHFASSLPANDSTNVHFPIASSDGEVVVQIHEGPILW